LDEEWTEDVLRLATGLELVDVAIGLTSVELELEVLDDLTGDETAEVWYPPPLGKVGAAELELFTMLDELECCSE